MYGVNIFLDYRVLVIRCLNIQKDVCLRVCVNAWMHAGFLPFSKEPAILKS